MEIFREIENISVATGKASVVTVKGTVFSDVKNTLHVHKKDVSLLKSKAPITPKIQATPKFLASTAEATVGSSFGIFVDENDHDWHDHSACEKGMRMENEFNYLKLSKNSLRYLGNPKHLFHSFNNCKMNLSQPKCPELMLNHSISKNLLDEPMEDGTICMMPIPPPYPLA